MANVHQVGLTRLSESDSLDNDESQKTNVVFVHGLRGHPVETWRSEQSADGRESRSPTIPRRTFGNRLRSKSRTPKGYVGPSIAENEPPRIYWPKDFLAEDLPQAVVWTYGYSADIVGEFFKANNQNNIYDNGRDLQVKLERVIDNQGPIVFVAHSLGGIIVQDAIRRSEEIRKRTELIIFLGTPHRGSALAGWGEILANLASLALQDTNKDLVKSLYTNDAALDNINEQFTDIVVKNDIQIHSFQEARGIALRRGKYGKVVDEFSSKIGLPRVEIVESIDADHVQMARCSSKSDEVYRSISGVLEKHIHCASYRPNNNAFKTQSVTLTNQSKPANPLAEDERKPYNLSLIDSHERVPYDESTSGAYIYLPVARNKRFVGRTGKLEELEARYFMTEGCQRVALVGLGGIGKTQIALEFAHRVKQQRPRYSIFWISAVSKASFEQSYKEIAKKCAIPLRSPNKDLKDSVKYFLENNLAGEWLIVVDNSDDEDVLFGAANEQTGMIDYVPESENGLVLYTTRHRETAVSLAGSDLVVIEAMDKIEAESFFSKSLVGEHSLHDAQTVKALLSELTYLPLAIAQAAAYINAMQISIQDYLNLLRDTEENTISLLSREFRDNTRYKGSKNSIAATWLVSFNQIRQAHPVAADLLSFMSCIECKAIPRSILPCVVRKEQMVYAIGMLRAYAFLAERDNGDCYDMHRLVHLAIKAWIGKEGEMQRVKESVAAHLKEKLSMAHKDNRSEWRHYLPHALRFLRNTEDWRDVTRYELCMYVGSCLRIDNQLNEAVALLQEAVSWYKDYMEETSPARLEVQEELALAYMDNGQVLMSIQLFEEVFRVQGKIFKPDNPNRLITQHSLAVVYQLNGQFAKSIKLLEEVNETENSLPEDRNHSPLLSQYELAVAYQESGQVKLAIEMLEKIIAVYKRDYPTLEGVLDLEMRRQLAMSYQMDGKPECAIEILELDLGMLEKKTYKEDDVARLDTLGLLAIAHRDYGQLNEAIGLLEEVLTIKNKSESKDHYSRLAFQKELAKTYKKDKQVQKAIELLEEVFEIEKESLRRDHPSRLKTQYHLAKAYRIDGQVRKATELLEEVVAIEQDSVEKNLPSLLKSKYELAKAHAEVGNVKKAVEFFEEIVAVDDGLLEEYDSVRMNCPEQLAFAYKEDGQLQKAIDLFEKVIAVQRKSLRKDYECLVTQHECALAYYANGQLDKGLQLLEHVMAVAKENSNNAYPDQHKWALSLAKMQAEQTCDKKDVRGE